MADWFSIINVQNLLLILFGFLIGRLYPLIKKFGKFLEKEQVASKV
jgi:hypothetical protein